MSSLLEEVEAFAGLARRERYPLLVDGGDPAAGAEWIFTVPGGVLWQLVSVSAEFVTDGTVVNRFVTVVVDDQVRIFYRSLAQQAQTASETVRYSFGPGLATAADAGSPALTAPTPPGFVLLPRMRLRSLTGGIAGGDNWGAPALYVIETEWTSDDVARAARISQAGGLASEPAAELEGVFGP